MPESSSTKTTSAKWTPRERPQDGITALSSSSKKALLSRLSTCFSLKTLSFSMTNSKSLSSNYFAVPPPPPPPLIPDKQLTWFTSTGGTSPADDTADILNLTHKDYRTLILANNISLFDFRLYLFG